MPIPFFKCPPQRWLTLIALLSLSGCSLLSSDPEPTRLDLTLAASDRLNPDQHDRPSPVVLRLFELRHPVAFETADFFSLYERPRDTLAADLLVSEELELRPGETRRLKLLVESGRHLGVLAAYRELNETRWRQVLTLGPGQRNQAVLLLDHNGIEQRRGPPAPDGEW